MTYIWQAGFWALCLLVIKVSGVEVQFLAKNVKVDIVLKGFIHHSFFANLGALERSFEEMKFLSIGFLVTPKSFILSAHLRERGQLVGLGLLRSGCDTTVVKSQLAMISHFLSVVSQNPENFSCVGIGVIAMKILHSAISCKLCVPHPLYANHERGKAVNENQLQHDGMDWYVCPLETSSTMFFSPDTLEINGCKVRNYFKTLVVISKKQGWLIDWDIGVSLHETSCLQFVVQLVWKFVRHICWLL